MLKFECPILFFPELLKDWADMGYRLHSCNIDPNLPYVVVFTLMPASAEEIDEVRQFRENIMASVNS